MKSLFLIIFILISQNAFATKMPDSRCWYFNNNDYFDLQKASLDRTVDYILVSKSQQKLLAFHKHNIEKSYNIALSIRPFGHKVKAGDLKTPNGQYRIEYKNPNSEYHLSLKISYPNAADLARARSLGVDPGGDIMIHGLPTNPEWYNLVHVVHPWINWTRGCIAVSNQEIEELYEFTKTGTVVEICE